MDTNKQIPNLIIKKLQVKNLQVKKLEDKKLINKNFEHIHFSESVKSGYFKPLQLPKIIASNIEDFVVDHLNPGEQLRNDLSFGLDASLASGLSFSVPGFNVISTQNSASAGVACYKLQGLLYTKDTHGALHLIKEKNNIKLPDFCLCLIQITL